MSDTRHHLLRRLTSAIAVLAIVMPVLVTVATPAVATAAATPTGFISSLGDETIRAITDTALDEKTRLETFRRLFFKGFDVHTISRFVLGRYWREATPDQQQEYQALFADFILDTYARRFSRYSGETLKVDGERQLDDKDTLVASEIASPDGVLVKVDWRVRRRDGDLKIIDVVVENKSMGISQREDFASVIRRGGGNIEALLAELRARVAPK
jgi:phospholipid transport system substrate-binding protein